MNEVPASPQATSDEGTLRERLTADLEAAGILPWTNDGQRLITTCESVLATERQKAQAEVINWQRAYNAGSAKHVVESAAQYFKIGMGRHDSITNSKQEEK